MPRAFGSKDVDAVIAALRTVLQEAEERHGELWWETHIVNRWIDQLRPVLGGGSGGA